MADRWDTIVIGAGLGGLTAAAYLAKAGLRVLVLEKNAHPGGTAYEYLRKGFAFPMGPLGFGCPQWIQDTLTDLEVGDNLEFSRVHYRIRAFGLDLPVSLPFSEMKERLSACFPSETRGIGLFFEEIQRRSRDISNLWENQDISASEYLHEHIKDWRLRRILGSIGTREPYSGLFLLSAMWSLMCHQGIWYPREGMKSFCERWTKAVTRCGQVWLAKEAVRIRVEHGSVKGVDLKNGTEIESAFVISNTDYKNTFLRLVDREALPPDWHRAVSRARQTGSIIQVCVGVDTGNVDLSAFKEASRLIYRRAPMNSKEKDVNWEAEEIDPELLTSQEIEVSLWGEVDKGSSNGSRAAIVIRTEAEYPHFARYRSSSGGRIPAYQEYKIRLGHALVHEVQNLLPGIEKAMKVFDVATPLTFEDQGGRSEGAVAGWSWNYENFHDNQPRELIRTPIRGLYMAGYQAFSALFMGGVPTAIESGKRAAHAVIEKMDPSKEILIPLSQSQ